MHSVVLLQIYFLGGPCALMAKIFESLVSFRPLGGSSTLWTCHIFYPLEGQSTLRTKIPEPLGMFRLLGRPCILWSSYVFTF